MAEFLFLLEDIFPLAGRGLALVGSVPEEEVQADTPAIHTFRSLAPGDVVELATPTGSVFQATLAGKELLRNCWGSRYRSVAVLIPPTFCPADLPAGTRISLVRRGATVRDSDHPPDHRVPP